jgi:hypothetical protein
MQFTFGDREIPLDRVREIIEAMYPGYTLDEESLMRRGFLERHELEEYRAEQARKELLSYPPEWRNEEKK